MKRMTWLCTNARMILLTVFLMLMGTASLNAIDANGNGSNFNLIINIPRAEYLELNIISNNTSVNTLAISPTTTASDILATLVVNTNITKQLRLSCSFTPFYKVEKTDTTIPYTLYIHDAVTNELLKLTNNGHVDDPLILDPLLLFEPSGDSNETQLLDFAIKLDNIDSIPGSYCSDWVFKVATV